MMHAHISEQASPRLLCFFFTAVTILTHICAQLILLYVLSNNKLCLSERYYIVSAGGQWVYKSRRTI